MKRPVEALLAAITLLLGAVMLLGVVLNFGNALLRYGFGTTLRWAEEIMVFGLVLIVALGTVVASARSEHLRIDALQSVLPGWMRVVSNLILAATFAYLAMQSNVVVSMMLRLGQKSVAAQVPMWIPHGFVLVAFAGGALASLYAIWCDLRRPPAPTDLDGQKGKVQ
jgi:TRAP-type C4-dicarboxylate transport system permease small subunit